MKPIKLLLPEPYIDGLDRLVERRMYANRSEAIRTSIRDLILWHRENKK